MELILRRSGHESNRNGEKNHEHYISGSKENLGKTGRSKGSDQQLSGNGDFGQRLQLRNNKELILKLFEIEKDDSIIEVFTHLKALYDEQWGDAEATAPPSTPGKVEEESSADVEEEEFEKSKSAVVAEVS